MNVGGSLIVGTGDVVIPGTSDIKKDLYAFGAIRTDGTGGQLPVGKDVYSGGNSVANLDITGRLFVPDPATLTRTGVNVAANNIVQLDVPQVSPCPCEAERRVPIVDLVTFARDNNDNDLFVDDPATPGVNEAFDATQWSNPAVTVRPPSTWPAAATTSRASTRGRA